MKKLKIFSLIVLIIAFFPFLEGCKCSNKESEDDYIKYLNSNIEKIEKLTSGDFTYQKDIIDINEDGTEGDPTIIKATYSSELYTYLIGEIEGERVEFYNYVMTKPAVAPELYVRDKGTMYSRTISREYIQKMIRESFREDFSVYYDYYGMTYEKMKNEAENQKLEMSKFYNDEGYIVNEANFSINFTKLNSEDYQMTIYRNLNISKNEVEITEIYLDYKIKYSKDRIISSSYIYNYNIFNKNENEEIINSVYSGNKINISIDDKYSKEFFATVEIPNDNFENNINDFPTTVEIYCDGEKCLDKTITFDTYKGTTLYDYIELNTEFGFFKDETYLEDIDYTDQFNTKIFGHHKAYVISKSFDTNLAKIIVVYLQKDEAGVEHIKTTYQYVYPGRYELDLEIDGVMYNDEINVNYRKNNYESFGTVKGELYIVHCYSYNK